MKMLNSLILGILFSVSFGSAVAQTRPGSLKGIVMDSVNNEPMPFVNVVLKDDSGSLVSGGTTDNDGKYNINPVAPGEYDVQVSFTGYRTLIIKGVLVSPNAPTVLDFKMNSTPTELPEMIIYGDLPMVGKPFSRQINSEKDL